MIHMINIYWTFSIQLVSGEALDMLRKDLSFPDEVSTLKYKSASEQVITQIILILCSYNCELKLEDIWREYNRNTDVYLEVWGSKFEGPTDVTSWRLGKSISGRGNYCVGFLRQERAMPTWKPKSRINK